MTNQYKGNSPTPKITANTPDKKEKKLDRQIRDLEQTVQQQAELIDRMHRDIVRLRVAINEVSARIK